MAAGRRPSASASEPDRPVSPASSDAGSSRNVFDDANASEYAPSIVAPSEHNHHHHYRRHHDEDDHLQDPFDDPSPSSLSLTEAASYPQYPHQHQQERQNDGFLSSDPSAETSRPRDSVYKPLAEGQPSEMSDNVQDHEHIPQQQNDVYQPRPLLSLETSQANLYTPQQGQVPVSSDIPSLTNSPLTAGGSAGILRRPVGSPRSAQSHTLTSPYAVYPLVNPSQSNPSLARIPSGPSDRSSNGPAHPYNLYPQDISSTVSDMAQPTAIPVGFPGHTQQFHRRLGPEGEEQDIVGPDGHLEQLPPYSRFPDQNISNKVATPAPVVVTSSASFTESRADSESINMQGEASSSRTGSRANLTASPTTDTRSTVVASDTSMNEKAWSEKTLKEKSKTKICRVCPLWVILLIIFVIAFIFIVCASVIGSFVKKHSSTDNANASSGTDNSTSVPELYPSSTLTYIDATPTDIPPDKAPLPTGTFMIPLGGSDAAYPYCLSRQQYNSWSCQLPLESSLCVTIEQRDDKAFLNTCNNQSLLTYGTQRPQLLPQTLRLVSDLDAVNLGAAWHFQGFYDKLVIVPKDVLQADSGSTNKKRETTKNFWERSAPATHQLAPRQADGVPINVGDEVWFCSWEDTFIEGFIYASISNPAPTSVVSPEPTGPYTPDVWTANEVAINAINDLYSTTWWSSSAVPYLMPRDKEQSSSSIVISTSSAGIASSTYTSSAQSPPSTTLPSSLPAAPAPPATSTQSTPTPSATCIPKFVKLEERRLRGLHPQASCTLFRKMENLLFEPVNDAGEKPISVNLNEDDVSIGQAYGNKFKRHAFGRSMAIGGGAALERRRAYDYLTEVDQTCYCQWTSEQFD